ncbi:MAG: 1-acylglycerol-3-phosphate O-acyltransferase, partial [Bacteroidota bacterium]
SAEDMPLLEIVGHPRPLNPDIKLSGIAFENGWPLYRFDEGNRNGILNILRTGLAAGTLVPAALRGITTGALSLSWRDGVNSMMATVGDLGAMMAGIQLLVKGEGNLWSHRPAVFTFNHQSSADLIIVAKLLRKDARAIAKKSLQYAPILGQLMMAAGIIFIDRGNREKAIEAMKPAVDALTEGTSIAIAPEGTRSVDYTLGRFKKGAFHLAMQAKVPIVPIVILNAHDAMPKGTNVFKPSVIEVVVLDPIATHHWKAEELDDRIREVRNAYLRELGQEEEPLLLN